MNVASLEVSKELYELSGWKDDSCLEVSGWINAKTPVYGYSLGYLLRKVMAADIGEIGVWTRSNSIAALANIEDLEEHTLVDDQRTLEDTVAKLAIELFKQGNLTR